MSSYKKLLATIAFVGMTPAITLAADLLRDPQFMTQAKSTYNLDRETQIRCAALGLDSVRKIALYRLISRRMEGALQEMHESPKTISPALENAKQQNPNASTKELSRQLELFGQPELVKFIQSMSDLVYDHMGQPLRVTAMTRSSEFNKDEHCEHLHGLSVDFRPLPGIAPTTWTETDKQRYDREMNKNIVKFLISSPEVRRIFFNDPSLLNDTELATLVAQRKHNDPGFEYRSLTYIYNDEMGAAHQVNHDNHVHVELKGDPSVWRATEAVYKQLSGAKP